LLIAIRFYAKKGLNNLWNALEKDIWNFYSQRITPLYVVQEAGKEYLAIVFDIKDLNEFENFLMSNPTIRQATRSTRSIPLHQPFYFDLPKGHPEGLQRYNVFLRISPDQYRNVNEKIPTLKFPKGVHLTYSSFSFGDDDIILSFLAEGLGKLRKFITRTIESMKGVRSVSVSRVVRSRLLTSRRNWNKHRKLLLYPVGGKVEGARKKFERERLTMTVIMRMHAHGELSKLWKSMSENIAKFESEDFIPLYASQQNVNDYITMVAEIRNFETINDLFSSGMPDVIQAEKWRTYPLLKPMYFLVPKDAPEKLERYLISIRVEPAFYQDVYKTLVTLDYPENVFLSYISYSLGSDDILLSLLTRSKDDVELFAEQCIDTVQGITSYNISSQLRTVRLTSKKVWLSHRNKHLSSYHVAHSNELNRKYDWTEWENYLAEQGGPFLRDLYQED